MSISIPRIPTSWPKWDWTQSNGSATAAQTQASLAALQPMTRTDHFRHEVWNDMVDALADVLTEAGLSWDGTYTTAADAKISAGGKLTAAKFNSVVHNILIQFDQPWMRWEYDAEAPEYSPFSEAGPRGFLGRTEVRGKTETGDVYEADNVYGWYIYELTRRLNVLIDMLADNADWAELADSETVKFIKDIFLSGDEARAMRVVNDMVSSGDLRLLAIPVIGLVLFDSDALRIAEETISMIVYRSVAMYRFGKIRMRLFEEQDMPPGQTVSLEALYAELYLALTIIAELTSSPSTIMAVLDRINVETNIDPTLCADDSVVLATDEQRQSLISYLLDDTLLLARAKPLFLLWTLATILTGGLRELTVDSSMTIALVNQLAVAFSGNEEIIAVPGVTFGAGLNIDLGETINALLRSVPGDPLAVRLSSALEDSADIESSTKPTIAAFAELAVMLLYADDLDLDVETIEYPWYDPIQTGSNIYIRSVADPVQTGSNVYIGRE